MIVKGVLCQPNEIGKVIRVSTESGMLKAAINATQYEMTYFKDKTVAFVVDEFAKILGKRFNRAIFKDGTDVPETVLQGTFLIVGVTEDGFRDLSDDEIKKYLDLFELPQKFFYEDGELCVVKFRPNAKTTATATKYCNSFAKYIRPLIKKRERSMKYYSTQKWQRLNILQIL